MHFHVTKSTAALGLFVALSGSSQAALIDRGSGLIFDTVLNVTWLQDANYARTSGYQVPGRAAGDLILNGTMDWQESVAWADSLSYFDAARGVSWTDWHLPRVSPVQGGAHFVSATSTDGSTDDSYSISAPGSVYAGTHASQLAYLYFNTLGNVGRCPLIGGFGACTDPSAPRTVAFNAGPFINLDGFRWTNSNQDLPYPADAWAFVFQGSLYGQQNAFNATGYCGRRLAWAVRDGDVGVVPEPGTGVLVGAALLLGLALRLRARG